MSTLQVTCQFKSGELYQAELPVEVLRPDMVLVKRGLTSQRMELVPGRYVVTARLPAGLSLRAEVDLGPQQDKTVDLILEPAEQSPNESQEVQRFVRGAVGVSPEISRRPPLAWRLGAGLDTGPFPGPLEGVGQGGVAAVVLRAFTGNVLSGPFQQLSGGAWLKRVGWTLPPGVTEFEIADPQITLVQVLHEGARPLNLLLPSSAQPAQPSSVVFQRGSDGQLLSVNAHPRDLTADLLLQYGQRGLTEEASTAVGEGFDVGGKAYELLHAKRGGPVSAAVGAYTLLRLGHADQIPESWTDNLYRWFPWMPDGIPIRVEHLARLGRHGEAIRILLELPLRGLPIFGEGLSLAVYRLQRYTQLSPSRFTPEETQQALQLLQRLQDYSRFIDFREPVVTFTGLQPDQPDAKRLEGESGQLGGIDVLGQLL
jgi:hypothetical protein